MISNSEKEIKFKNRIEHDYDNLFNFLRRNWKKILIIIGCSLLYAFGQIQFLLKASVVSDGVEAISGSLAYLIPILRPYITVLYLALNIPLIIIFWNKLGKPFIITSIIFLFFNAIFGFIFGLEVIDNFLTEKVIVIVQGANIKNPSQVIVDSKWGCFVYIILAVAFCSPPSAIVWKLGSSTGGTDLIAHFISTKKKKPVGLFVALVGLIMATIGIIILYISKQLGNSEIKSNIIGFENIVSPQTISTYLYILLNGFIINLIYPKYEKVKLKFDTKNKDELIKYFDTIKFWHPYKLSETISGYTKEKIYTIETIVLLLESDEIAWKIKQEFPDIWISISPISKIYGRFDYSRID